MTSAVTEERTRVLRLSNLPTLAGPIMPLPAVRVSPLLQKPQVQEPECSTALAINVERLLLQSDVSYLWVFFCSNRQSKTFNWVSFQLCRSSSLKLFTHLSLGTTFRQAVFNKQRGRYDINRKFIYFFRTTRLSSSSTRLLSVISCWFSLQPFDLCGSQILRASRVKLLVKIKTIYRSWMTIPANYQR